MTVTVMEEFAQIVSDNTPNLYYGEGGQIYINHLPETFQDDGVCLVQYGAYSSFPSPHDEYRIQARIRGADKDYSLAGYNLADSIWRNTHGWIRPPSYNGVIELVVAAGPPMSIGYDDQDRPEWVINFILECRQDIKHRSL